MTLPNGFVCRLSDDLLTRSEVLVGGSPLTAARLSATAQSMLTDDRLRVDDPASARLAERLLETGLAHPDLVMAEPVRPSDLTVVVPVRDRPVELGHTLRALGGLRVVVVDDASLDRSAIARVAHAQGADLVRLEDNVGPAGAHNAGLATVRTELVAFVDSDVEITTADLLLLAGHCADPAVAAVGPRVVGHSRRDRPRWWERYDAVASALDVGRRPGIVRPGSTTGWLPSACLVARTRSLGAGFDPSLRVAEDVDLVWRLAAGGSRVRYEPGVVALHATRDGVRPWLGRIVDYGTGAAALAERHPGAVAPAVLHPVLASAAATMLVRNRWSAPAAAIGMAWTMRRVRRALPPTADRDRTAARVAARALGGAVWQESALLLRHWWPVALPAAALVRPGRRAIASALVVDAIVVLAEHRRRETPESAALLVAGRRLTDLAYGAGLWLGCWRHRSARALLPRRPGRP